MTAPSASAPSASPARTEANRAFVAAAMREAHADMLLDDRFHEPIIAHMKRNFATACWVFDAQTGHRVFVGDGCLDRARPELTVAQRSQYVGRYVHHERAHAMYTERDRAVVERWLSDAKVPFGLYNWTEDARVEHRYVTESRGGFSFGWGAYEPIDASSLAVPETQRTAASVMLCAFFNLIQTEGAVEDVRALYPPSAAVAVDDAVAFYRACINAASSRQAVDVAASMLRKYPEMDVPTGRCGLALGISMQGPQGAAALAEFVRDDEPQKDGGPHGTPARGASGGDGHGFIGHDLLSSTPLHALDAQRVARLADRLSELSVRKSIVRDTGTRPGPRLSLRHALRGEARWHAPEQAPQPKRIRRVFLLGDVSGSMDGSPLEALAYLIAALSAANERGLVHGDVVLSTTAHEGVSQWLHKPLPWTLTEAACVDSHRGEGLAGTLRQHDALIEGADLTLVLTDADIGGPAITHKAYRKRGLMVVGAYVNSDEFNQEAVIEKMGEHFDRMIVRNSVEALMDTLVLQPLR